MAQQLGRRKLYNPTECRRFVITWLTFLLWAAFLIYMLLFHFMRDSFQPMVMQHFSISQASSYAYVEMTLFLYLLWSCCMIAILAMINSWGKKRRRADHIAENSFAAMMIVTVMFAFYYAHHDLHYLDRQIDVLLSYLVP